MTSQSHARAPVDHPISTSSTKRQWEHCNAELAPISVDLRNGRQGGSFHKTSQLQLQLGHDQETLEGCASNRP